MERFLYRLGQSPHRDRFVLKGAMMLIAWRAPSIRPTMDIDLLGRGANSAADLVEVMRSLSHMEVTPPDGLAFDAESVVGEQIIVESEYVGARLRFLATLGTARVRMQVASGGEPPRTIESPQRSPFLQRSCCRHAVESFGKEKSKGVPSGRGNPKVGFPESAHADALAGSWALVGSGRATDGRIASFRRSA